MKTRVSLLTFAAFGAAILLTAAAVDRADAQSLISLWTLNGNIDSGVPQPALYHDANVSVSPLSAAGLATGTHLDAFVADGWPTGSFDPDTYFECTVTPSANFAVTYESMQFSLYNDSAGTSTWEVRSSLDGFAAPLAGGTTSLLTGGGTPVFAFLLGVGTQAQPVTFRLYTHTNSGTVDPQQRGLRGSAAGGLGLRIDGSAVAIPLPFVVSGRFLYEDRLWDGNGYTGAVQNLPIRHADVEIVDANGNVVLGEGSTDANGEFAVEVALVGAADLYARVLTSADNSGIYRVVVAGGTGDILDPYFTHAVPTDVVPGHVAGTPLDLGDWLIADTDGTGIAQAFNILDRAMDGLDWFAQPQVKGSYPSFGQGTTIRWGPDETHSGSGYSSSSRTLTVASPGSGDTDGWSDTVILHEFSHYLADLSLQDDSPGGPHYLGDNHQDPALSYNEGLATYLCAEVRAFTAFTAGTDDHVSLYADLAIPPPVGIAGGLEFAYDFETGTYTDGGSIIQFGQANESNVTSTLWDLADGPTSPDESPGVDEDPLAGHGADVWTVLSGYIAPLPLAEYITFEDFFQGWKVILGPAYLAPELDEIVNVVNDMRFVPDTYEPDDDVSAPSSIDAGTYELLGPDGGVVINELSLGPSPADAVELYNSSNLTIDIGLYQVVCTHNTGPLATYTFAPSFLLAPGAVVYLHDNGDPAEDTATDVYLPGNIWWANEESGACTLLDATGTGVDFVRWDAPGDPSDTPVPPGLVFTGSVVSPPDRLVLGRDNLGTDTDDASDFTHQTASGAAPNLMPVQERTFFDVGDVDVVSVSMLTGKTYVLRTLDLFSDANSHLELLDVDQSTVLDANDDRVPGTLESMITFTAPQTGTYYARVTNVSTRTDYGLYSLLAYVLPPRPTAVEPLDSPAERVTELQGTYPNPFNPRVTIAFELDRVRPVTVEVYDARGKRVRRVLAEVRPAGDHTVVWDGTDADGRAVAGGVYFVRFASEEVERTTKVTLLK